MVPKTPHRAAHNVLVVLAGAEDDEDISPLFTSWDDGGQNDAILTVTIGALNHDSPTLWMNFDGGFNVYSSYKATGDWIDEFTSLVQCNGSAEGQEEASMADMIFRWLAMSWNLFFAMVPPSSYCGSWICFCACLFFIALVTAVIAALSELFGCELGMCKDIAA